MSAIMRADERQMLRDSLRRLLMETDAAKVPAALDNFGWTELLASDPPEAVAALFAMQGETVSATPALNAVMARPLLAAAALPSGGAGKWTVVLPSPAVGSDVGVGSGDAGGARRGPSADAPAAGRSASGYIVAAGAPLGRGLTVSGSGGDAVLRSVDCEPSAARLVEGIDPDLGLVHVDPAGVAAGEVLARGDVVADAWKAAVAGGRVALACELAGVSRAMLALGVEHAQERRQFGQPIGKFQAVKHRLAEAKVALVAAEAAIDEAATEPGPLTALLAKLWAGRAARMTAKQVQQVLGGMGFTWEHPFHRHLRRALALDGLLGSAAELQHDLGRTLLATGDVPQLARL